MNQKKHGGFAHFENGRKDKNPFQKCHYDRKKYICFLRLFVCKNVKTK